MNGQGIPVMVFSIDEITNKAIICACVPEKSEMSKQLEVSEWLTTALGPLKGKGGKGKGGLASGQVITSQMLNLLAMKYAYCFLFENLTISGIASCMKIFIRDRVFKHCIQYPWLVKEEITKVICSKT